MVSIIIQQQIKHIQESYSNFILVEIAIFRNTLTKNKTFPFLDLTSRDFVFRDLIHKASVS